MFLFLFQSLSVTFERDGLTFPDVKASVLSFSQTLTARGVWFRQSVSARVGWLKSGESVLDLTLV